MATSEQKRLQRLQLRLQKVPVEVHVSQQTRDGKITILHTPLITAFSRNDYIDDPDALFNYLAKRVPFKHWVALEYELADLWYQPVQVYDRAHNTPEQDVKQNVEHLLSINMLRYLSDDNRVSPFTWQLFLRVE